MIFLNRCREYVFSKEGCFVCTFFLTLAVAGLFSFRSFGVPYDEGTLSQLGIESYAYVFEGKAYPEDYHFRYHGTAVELPIVMFLNAFGITESIDVAYVRHFAVFGFLFLAVASFYVLARRIFGNWRIALFGSLFFVLSPRIFAHGFYNSRDIPTMALFVLSGVTLLRLLEKKSVLRAVLHGIVCGAALAIRMPSLFLIALTGLFLFLDFLRSSVPWAPRLKQYMVIGAIYLVSTAVTTYALWPLLWAHPIKHFLDAYVFMKNEVGLNVQFLGVNYPFTPWRYIPGWIAFTTPLLYSALFLFGCMALVFLIIRTRGRVLVTHASETLLPLAWFFGPIVAIVLGHSFLYQEWRHVLFLYPAFLLIALHGLSWFWELFAAQRSLILRRCITFIFSLPLLSLVVWMIRNHPHDYVYYAVPRAWISQTLELDYWGLSTKQAIGWIEEHDERTLVSYHSSHNIGHLNGMTFFAPGGVLRLVPITESSKADYLLVLHEPGKVHPFESQKEIFAIKVDGEKLVSIHEGYPDARAYMDDLRIHPEKL